MSDANLTRNSGPQVTSQKTNGAKPAARQHQTNFNWEFPFPVPGRWQGKKKIPANTEKRLPWTDMDAYDHGEIKPRFIKSRVSREEFMARVREIADDAGMVSIDHPALAHEVDEIRYVYPMHARWWF